VLRDVSVLDLSTDLFGQQVALPVVLAPTAE
jgi:L-rhamnose-H+ transport protein